MDNEIKRKEGTTTCLYEMSFANLIIVNFCMANFLLEWSYTVFCCLLYANIFFPSGVKRLWKIFPFEEGRDWFTCVKQRMKCKNHIAIISSCWSTPPTWYYKACPPPPTQSLFVYSVPECNPHVFLHSMRCPPLLGCEYMWLITCC